MGCVAFNYLCKIAPVYVAHELIICVLIHIVVGYRPYLHLKLTEVLWLCSLHLTTQPIRFVPAPKTIYSTLILMSFFYFINIFLSET